MKLFSPTQALAALAFLSLSFVRLHVGALELDPTSPDSIKNVTSLIAKQLVAQYATIDDKGVHILGGYPGILYMPFYWWEAGAMFGTLLDYWHYTGDDQYNGLVRDALIHNFGENLDLMPANQSKNEGNDDQVFWAFSMIAAAEYKLQDPPPDKPGWLAITQSVFNQFLNRFEKEVADGNCGGGMRWQIYQYLDGYRYKNVASNGGLFHLGARLAMYTKNDSYATYAEKVYDWMAASPLLQPPDGTVNDGTSMKTVPMCKDADRTQWTYNYGILIAGTAYMYNYTNGEDKWKKALTQYINKSFDMFYPQEKGGIMVEPCEYLDLCNADQQSFKAYLSRWLGNAMQMAPFTYDLIMPRLTKSAVRAAQTCNGASQHNGGNYQCGMRWYMDGWDGHYGVGTQMTALNTISILNAARAPVPYTGSTGGTSQGNPGLNSQGSTNELPIHFEDIDTGDKAGAAILTIIVVVAWMGGAWWMIKT